MEGLMKALIDKHSTKKDEDKKDEDKKDDDKKDDSDMKESWQIIIVKTRDLSLCSNILIILPQKLKIYLKNS